jgi:Mrp family chromosome partitioning ATPase
MESVLKILKHSESVLAKKIKGLKDGKPKWAAAEQMNELRQAIRILETCSDIDKYAQDFAVYVLSGNGSVGASIEQKYEEFLHEYKNKSDNN